MQESKLIQLLRTLSEVELKQLGLFLKSPFHNSNKKVLALFLLLKPYHSRNYESTRLQKETLFYKIFPADTTYHDSNMRALMSSLNQRIEDFLIEKEVRKNKILRKELLAKVYSNKNLYHHFEKINRKQNNKLSQRPIQDMEVHQQQFNNNWAYYFNAGTQKHQTKIPSLEATMHHLDQFYLQAKFRLGIEMKNREQILQETYDILFWEYLIKELQKQQSLQQPVFQLYSNYLKLQNKFDAQLFRAILQIYTTNIQQLGQWEKRAFLALLLNILAKQTYLGNSEYFEVSHQLHLLAIEQGLLVENDKVSVTSFFNYAGCSSYIGNFDWTAHFVKTYQKYLEPSIKKDALSLIAAYTDYYKAIRLKEKERFEEALDKLQKIKNNGLFFALHSRTLTMRIYYDYFLIQQNNSVIFMDYIIAFQKYIQRNLQISPLKKPPYLHFISYAKKIAKLKINPNVTEQEIESLKMAIQQEESLFSKVWLKAKMEEF